MSGTYGAVIPSEENFRKWLKESCWRLGHKKITYEDVGRRVNPNATGTYATNLVFDVVSGRFKSIKLGLARKLQKAVQELAAEARVEIPELDFEL